MEKQIANLDNLIDAVMEAYEEYSPVKLNKIWLTYQQCMIEMMKLNGKNKHKLPHMRKDVLLRQGTLPVSLTIPLDTVQAASAFVHEKADLLL